MDQQKHAPYQHQLTESSTRNIPIQQLRCLITATLPQGKAGVMMQKSIQRKSSTSAPYPSHSGPCSTGPEPLQGIVDPYSSLVQAHAESGQAQEVRCAYCLFWEHLSLQVCLAYVSNTTPCRRSNQLVQLSWPWRLSMRMLLLPVGML